MSENKVLILSQEFLNRIMVGLGEVQSKFAIPVLQDIEKQLAAAEVGAKIWVESIEAHITGVKLKAAQSATTATDKAPA
jgi:hypothetical protein